MLAESFLESDDVALFLHAIPTIHFRNALEQGTDPPLTLVGNTLPRVAVDPDLFVLGPHAPVLAWRLTGAEIGNQVRNRSQSLRRVTPRSGLGKHSRLLGIQVWVQKTNQGTKHRVTRVLGARQDTQAELSDIPHIATR